MKLNKTALQSILKKKLIQMVKGEIFTAQTTFEIQIKKLKILRIFVSFYV